jgi:hypothetical protein
MLRAALPLAASFKSGSGKFATASMAGQRGGAPRMKTASRDAQIFQVF